MRRTADWRPVVRAAREQGFIVEVGTRHTLIGDLDGRLLAVGGGSPSDLRGQRNLLATLRRAGLVWPWTSAQRRARRRAIGSQ